MPKRERRVQIARAALELFDERGYNATGMNDVAKVIGISASSIYNHYSSKQEILADISIGVHEDLLRFNAEELASKHGVMDRMRTAMRAHVIFHTRHAQEVRVANKELDSLEEPTRGVVTQLRRDYVARWEEIVARGVEEGLFHVRDLRIACWSLIDMGLGVSFWFSEEGKYSSEELADMYADMALRQLGVEPVQGAGEV